MNFDFSDDVTLMREEVRRILHARYPAGAVRQAADAGRRFDREFWAEIAGMGWVGVAIPEAYGGAGLGHEALCMIAEEVGAVLPPIPFASSACQASEALLQFGSEAQKQAWLPRLASGEIIGCLALAEGRGEPDKLVSAGGTGVKWPVLDGDIADIAILVGGDGLWLVELDQPGAVREPVETLDIVRGAVRLDLRHAAAERLEGSDRSRLLDRLAILQAFEAVGGTRAALDSAVDYAKDRYAFGRPIASFQAIKHKLADIYVALEIARSNAYYGAWALENESDLPVAAAAALLAAGEAYALAAKENIHVNGGMGFTWESDCHLHYRRARLLALSLGSPRWWRDRLVDRLGEAAAAPVRAEAA